MDLKSILNDHRPKEGNLVEIQGQEASALFLEIPALFFEEVLIRVKLTRIEILLLIFLYRKTWLSPNAHAKYGMTPTLEFEAMTEALEIDRELLNQTLRKLEEFGLMQTMRPGLYFIRRFFTEEGDKKYGQSYDNFL